MNLTFTDKDEIDYLEKLISTDIEIMQKKIDNRKKVLSTIKFAQERGDF